MTETPITKFPYELESLTWLDPEHSVNLEGVYCYCGQDKELQGPQKFKRLPMSWVIVVQLSLYNLLKRHPDRKFFQWKDEICKFIEGYWDYLAPSKTKYSTWNNTVASVLSIHTEFVSGSSMMHQTGWWTLRDNVPPEKKDSSKSKSATKKLDVSISSNSLKRKHTADKDDFYSFSVRDVKQKRGVSTTSSVKTTVITTTLNNQIISGMFPSSNFIPGRVNPEKIRKAIDKSLEKMNPQSLESCDLEKIVARLYYYARTNDRKEFQDHQSDNDYLIETSKSPREHFSKDPGLSLSSQIQSSFIDNGTTSNLAAVTTVDEKDSTHVKSEDIDTNKGPRLRLIFKSSDSNTHDDSLVKEIPNVIEDPDKSEKPNKKKRKKQSKNKFVMLDEREEWELLQRLDNSRTPLSPKTARFRRKLQLRRLKRGLGLKIFDLDDAVTQHLKSNAELEPIATTASIDIKKQSKVENDIKETKLETVNQVRDIEDNKVFEELSHTPYENSFASRLYGIPRLATTLTSKEMWSSPYHGRKLRPYIYRDYEMKPPKLKLLEEIVSNAHRDDNEWQPPPSSPIDFCYFQKTHLKQVNDLLQRCFWPGIDVTENLLFPDYSVVALYKRLVIGCAFMTPESYITYVAVASGWQKSGIGKFMLYHIIQNNNGKDITLHVSANNPAMASFKPEEFIVNFYDKYLPPGSFECKNAFFVRLRQ
ncbi:9962_t:CDS:10 [Ambispora leptoticha]|uniref:9962_t:CDS:1 n=1 Tax=Ambispora leptoticha TaxID=144679 RepID=A0A9N8VBX9_9GLOM|nr:9962_t:CDS:10 [Ambispora leptoticha]